MGTPASLLLSALADSNALAVVPEDSIESVRSLGAGRLDVYRHVVVPATLPELFTALRISSGTAVAILFFAESLAGSTGLGYFISLGRV